MRHDEARNDLVLSNLGFVSMIAVEYRSLGMPYEDLLNEGILGLITAATRFDSDKGVRFTTYAVWWIRKAILKALGDQIPIVRVTRYQRNKAAQRTRGGAEDASTWAALLKPLSLDATLPGASRRPFIDGLADDRATDPEREALRQDDFARLRRGFVQLTGRERAVLAARFGLAGAPVSTLRQIGDRIGLTRERVRQIEAASIKKLRAGLRDSQERSRAVTKRRSPSPPRDAEPA